MGPVHPLADPDTRTHGFGPVRTQVREGQDRTPDSLLAAAYESFGYEPVTTVRPDVWEERLQLITNPGQIGRNRFRLNVMSHINGEKTECVWRRFDR